MHCKGVCRRYKCKCIVEVFGTSLSYTVSCHTAHTIKRCRYTEITNDVSCLKRISVKSCLERQNIRLNISFRKWKIHQQCELAFWVNSWCFRNEWFLICCMTLDMNGNLFIIRICVFKNSLCFNEPVWLIQFQNVGHC